jgi:uncharacterized protein
MKRIVLDCNIFVSALLVPGSGPAQLLDLARERKIELLVSPPILSEIARVMRYPKIQKRHRLSPEQLDDLIASYAGFATVTPGKRRVKVVHEDPSDNIYLECALEGEADFIVSGDKHLLDLETFRGIPIVSPAAFLKIVAHEQESV